jgi:pimeloyl-ACP methyl ester carboxylesterase
MGIDRRSTAVRAMRTRSQFLCGIGGEQIIALCCLLPLCLSIGCAHTDEVRYMSADEIRESIIGNSLRGEESGGWKEDYLAADSDELEGDIRGHSKSALPYRGRWSIVGDSMCVEYETASGQVACFRFSKEKANKIHWVDETGALAFESDLIEGGEAERATPELTNSVVKQETIVFQHRENSLVGTLSLPAGQSPFPVILFVHGAGPTTRHWSFYEPMRDEFISRGFATLIWSKPGVDESTGDYLTQSMVQRAEAVEAAMIHIAERSDIDSDRIGLWGGSQAGWVVPIIASHRDVAFEIMMSCPAQNPLKQTLYLDGNLLASLEISELERGDALDEISTYYELIRTSSSYEDFLRGQELLLEVAKERSWYSKIPPQIIQQLSWFQPIDRGRYQHLRIFFVMDSPPELGNLQSPLLAIYGTNDIQVDWKLGSKAYEEVPRAAGNSDVTVELFDGADHTLMLPDDDGYLDFAPGFLTTMGEWLAARAR